MDAQTKVYALKLGGQFPSGEFKFSGTNCWNAVSDSGSEIAGVELSDRREANKARPSNPASSDCPFDASGIGQCEPRLADEKSMDLLTLNITLVKIGIKMFVQILWTKYWMDLNIKEIE